MRFVTERRTRRPNLFCFDFIQATTRNA